MTRRAMGAAADDAPVIVTEELVREAALAAERVGTVRWEGGGQLRLTRRVPDLVVARESAVGVTSLLEGMIMQTLAKYPNLPGSAELLRAGLEPVRDPARYGGRELRAGGTRAVLFEVEGTWCLYSAGSAANRDAAGDNGFNVVLREVLARLRPENVYLSTFSRLVRSPHFAGLLMQALEQNVDTLHAGETAIHMNTPFGRAMFQLLTLFSSMERDAQLTRLLLGQLAKHRNGKYLFSRTNVPLGYFVGTGGTLEVDPDAREAVATMIRVLGEASSLRSKVAEVGTHILASPFGARDRRWHYRDPKVPTLTSNVVTPQPWPPSPEDDSDVAGLPDGAVADARGTGGPALGLDPDAQAEGLVPVEDVLGEFEENSSPGVEDDPRDEEAAPAGDGNPDAPDDADSILLPPGRGTGVRRWLGLQAAPTMVSRWYELLSLYETGTYTVKHRNPLPGVKAYAEFEVVADETGDGPGHIKLPIAAPLPPGGWAAPEDFARARMRLAQWEATRRDSAQARTAGPPVALPLLASGNFWVDAGREHRLMGATRGGGYAGRYELFHRPERDPADQDTPDTRFTLDKRTGTREALVDAVALHRSVCDAVADAITNGVDGRLVRLPPEYVSRYGARSHELTAHDRLEVVEQQIRETEAEYERQGVNYGRLTDEGELRALEQRQVRTRAQLERYEARARELREEIRRDARPDVVHGHVQLLLAVLAKIRDADAPLPIEVGQDVAQVLPNFRLKAGPLDATWSCEVLVPLVDHTALRLGPVTGTVRNVEPVRAGRTTDEQADARAEAVAETLLTSDASREDVMGGWQKTGDREIERAIDWLSERLPRAAARAIVRCVVPETRRAVWDAIAGNPHADEFSAFAADVYLNLPPTVRTTANATWRWPTFHREKAVSWLFERGGSASYREMSAWAASVNLEEETLRDYTRSQKAVGQQFEWAPPQCPPECKVSKQKGCRAHGTIRLRACPHDCDGTIRILAPVPECPDKMLCDTCMRMPSGGPVFPESYRTVTQEEVNARDRLVTPNLAARRIHPHGKGIPAAIRAWARSQGRDMTANGRLPDEVVQAWAALTEEQKLAVPEFAALRARSGRPYPSRDEAATVRVWATEQGFPFNPRGRLTNELMAAWYGLPEPERARIMEHEQANRPPGRAVHRADPDAVTVRHWAMSRGLAVKPTGALPRAALEAWRALTDEERAAAHRQVIKEQRRATGEPRG